METVYLRIKTWHVGRYSGKGTSGFLRALVLEGFLDVSKPEPVMGPLCEPTTLEILPGWRAWVCRHESCYDILNGLPFGSLCGRLG
jgi:hypothetical protein